MEKNELVEEILKHKTIAICRNVPDEHLLFIAEALCKGGIKFIEVTFDQSGNSPQGQTLKQIFSLKKQFEDRMHVGAGTVLNTDQVISAFDAGAEYIISPDTNENVIRKTVDMGMVSIPGALTPTEIQAAFACGADFIKLFPAGEMGIGYVKAILAPLNHVKLLAVGGIDENNLVDFLKAGVKGAGIGSNIIRKDLVAAKDYAGITRLAKLYADISM